MGGEVEKGTKIHDWTELDKKKLLFSSLKKSLLKRLFKIKKMTKKRKKRYFIHSFYFFFLSICRVGTSYLSSESRATPFISFRCFQESRDALLLPPPFMPSSQFNRQPATARRSPFVPDRPFIPSNFRHTTSHWLKHSPLIWKTKLRTTAN